MTRTMIYAMFVVAVCIQTNEGSAGWVKKITGGRISTPEPIRKIAPNGVRVPNLIRRPTENSSSFGLAPSDDFIIQQNGLVYKRTIYPSNVGSRGGTSIAKQPTGRANLERNNQGQAYFVYSKASNSPRRAPQHDLRVQVHQYRDRNGNLVEERRLGNRVQSRRIVQSARPRPMPQPSFQQPQYRQQPRNVSPEAALTIGILQAIDQGVRNSRNR